MKNILVGCVEFCSTEKDLICPLHIMTWYSLNASSAVPKKPSLTATNKLIMVLNCSAEVIVSSNFTFYIISSQVQLPPFMLSQDQASYWHHSVRVKSSPHVLLTCFTARPNAAVPCQEDTVGVS